MSTQDDSPKGPDDPAAPAQNSGETAPPARVVGRPFTPNDPRINRGGRPPGLAKKIRELAGEEGEELAVIAFKIAKGKLKIAKPVVADGDIVMVKVRPSAKERMEAVKWMGDRGFGKTPQTVQVTGPAGGPLAVEMFDVTRLSDEQLEQLLRLQAALTPDAGSPAEGEGAPEGGEAPQGG
jgi:hypothetical protein